MARATLTPLYNLRDPPVWDYQHGPVPQQLAEVLPLPSGAATSIKAVVCVPFYSEDGYALSRGLQSLALQRADLRRYYSCSNLLSPARTAGSERERPLPELHVFAIADGWKQGDGARILSATMLEEIVRIFGPSLDTAALSRFMGDAPIEGDVESHILQDQLPDAVLVQLVAPRAPHARSDVLHPVQLDCTWVSSMQSRSTQAMTGSSAAAVVERYARRDQRLRQKLERKRKRHEAALAKRSRSGADPGSGPACPPPVMVPAPGGDGPWRPSLMFNTVMGLSSSAAASEKAPLLSPSVRSARSMFRTEEAHHLSWPPTGSLRPESLSPSSDRADSMSDACSVGDSEYSSNTSSRSSTVGDDSLSDCESTEDPRSVIAAGDPTGEGTAPTGAAELPIFLTLLIKRRNGRKHHSHRWFFEAFAPITRLRSQGSCRYYFATDCGTLYAPYCIAELIRHMERHPKCAAATAHQRIMALSDQAVPGGTTAQTWEAAWLRAVQAYDVESGLCTFNGMHANAGFLPVVPGPCGMFRAEALGNTLVARVREICSSPAYEDGLVQGNLKIAEDRILSCLLVLCEAEDDDGVTRAWQTHWVPSTTFFFEAEVSLKDLVLQRRRWLNGTTAGYLWLLKQPELWSGVRRFKSLPWAVFTLSLLQLLVFCIVFLMPGLLAITGYLSTRAVFMSLKCLDVETPTVVSDAVEDSVLAVLLTSFILHVGLARWGRKSFTGWAWWLRVALNMLTMLTSFAATLSLSVLSYLMPEKVIGVIGEDNYEDLLIAGSMSLLYVATPFFLALLHSPGSFSVMVRTLPAYSLFLPSIISDFFAYSLARFDDISWGTKAVGPSAGAGQVAGADPAAGAAPTALPKRAPRPSTTGAKGDSTTKPFLLLSQIADMETQRAARASTAAVAVSRRRVTALALSQVLACLGLVFGSFKLHALYRQYLLLVGCVLCVTGFSIMCLSMAYFLPLALHRRGAATCSHIARALDMAIFLGWLGATAAVGLLIVDYDYASVLSRLGLIMLYGTLAVIGLLVVIRCTIACCAASRRRALTPEEHGDGAM